ncbi:MAG: fatty-acyl-CoA synthase, partial [Solirubrobacterales bacterium]|nr:fatty-acyl-CoA synthase [Solirubrobacterales bacterium]
MGRAYLSDNIGSWTSLRARRDPDRTAVVCGGERTTYAELDARAARVAGALRDAGIQPGDRVAVALKNRVEFLELLFGVARAGAIFVPLNFRLAAEEVAYALGDSGSTLVVVQEDTAAAVAAALERLDGEPVRVLSVDGSDDPGYAAWRDAAEPADPHPIEPRDPVSIVYTSGTTGPPKGAVLTHEGVLVNVQNYLADWDL